MAELRSLYALPLPSEAILCSAGICRRKNFYPPISLLPEKQAGGSRPPADAFNGIVRKRFVSVSSRIVWLLRRLYKTGWANYNDLFVSGDRSELVATFLAVLELMKSGRITMNEDNTRLTFNRRSTSSDDGKES